MVSATKGDEAASPPRPKTDCLGPSPALAIAASGMPAKGMAAKLKNMDAVSNPFMRVLMGNPFLGSDSADMRTELLEKRERKGEVSGNIQWGGSKHLFGVIIEVYLTNSYLRARGAWGTKAMAGATRARAATQAFILLSL